MEETKSPSPDLPLQPKKAAPPPTVEERLTVLEYDAEWLKACQRERVREREQLITGVACIVFGFALALQLLRA